MDQGILRKWREKPISLLSNIDILKGKDTKIYQRVMADLAEGKRPRAPVVAVLRVIVCYIEDDLNSQCLDLEAELLKAGYTVDDCLHPERVTEKDKEAPKKKNARLASGEG